MRITIFVLLPLLLIGSAIADTIYMTDGKVIRNVKNIRTDDKYIYFVIEDYGSDTYTYNKQFVDRIEKGPVKPATSVRKKISTPKSANNRSSTGEGFAVKRFFKSSAEYMRVIIETDKRRKVKCAVYDKGGDVITVSGGYIDPPLTEFPIRTGDKTGQVKTIKCWPATSVRKKISTPKSANNRSSTGEGFAVKRFFKSSAEYMRVIIETDKRRKVKCAVYDKGGDVITVSGGYIDPPLTEFPIRTGDKTGQVKTIKCW